MTNLYINATDSMMELQDELNTKVLGKDWRKNEKAKWLRAAIVESAELLDHAGFKWWKHTEIDKDQIRLELVDIWHFLLSESLKYNVTAMEIVESFEKESMEDALVDFSSDVDILTIIEFFMQCLIEDGVFVDYFAVFACICEYYSLDFESLYLLYVGKNVLNKFRQDNGYKQGTYVKTWGIKEDNVHLAAIMKHFSLETTLLKEKVYSELTKAYAVYKS